MDFLFYFFSKTNMMPPCVSAAFNKRLMTYGMWRGKPWPVTVYACFYKVWLCYMSLFRIYAPFCNRPLPLPRPLFCQWPEQLISCPFMLMTSLITKSYRKSAFRQKRHFRFAHKSAWMETENSENPEISQRSFYTGGRWKSWRIDKKCKCK